MGPSAALLLVSPQLRKKLRGVLQFLRECGDVMKHPYDFDRLERKLGLAEGAPTPATTTTDGAPKLDIASMAAYLLSDDGAWVNGQVWSVNGGRFLK
jgi:NAD(P)-dependent dehydrogenase (short-subunit alcohol dehydrogenase family)